MTCKKIAAVLAIAMIVTSTNAQLLGLGVPAYGLGVGLAYGGIGPYGGIGLGYGGGYGLAGYGDGSGYGGYAYPKYNFAYGVQDDYTGDNKQRSEYRDGAYVESQYSSKLIHG